MCRTKCTDYTINSKNPSHSISVKTTPPTPSPSPETDIEEDDMEEEEEEVVEEEAEEEEEEEEEGNDEEAAEIEEAEEEEAATTVKDQEEYEYPIDSHFQGQDYIDNFYYDKNLQTAKASTQPQTRMDNRESYWCFMCQES